MCDQLTSDKHATYPSYLIIGRPTTRRMDEEGFPLLSVSSSIATDLDATHRDDPSFPPPGLPVSQDQESGEATAQQIMIIRRPPQVNQSEMYPTHDGCHRTDCMRPSQTDSRQVPDEHTHHRTFQIHMNFMCLCSSQDHVLRAPIRNISESSDSSPPPQKTPEDIRTRQKERKNRFRIPSGSSQTSKPKKESAIIISIWKEILLGASVFDYGSMEWEEIMKRFKYPFWLRKPFDTVTRHLPHGYLKLIHLLMFALRLLLRDICIIGLYYKTFDTHLRIHQIGQERGIQPVFTGKVYHGPITYSVRAQCTYCKAQDQSKASLRYFQSLREERQHDPVR